MWMFEPMDKLLVVPASAGPAAARDDWFSVLVALLIAAALVVGLLVLQTFSSRLHRRWTRMRHRWPQPPPPADGGLER